jgi:hypothetical protein
MLTHIYDGTWMNSSFIEKYYGKKFYRKSKTHFTFHIVFTKWCRSRDNVEQFARAGQATDNNMACAVLLVLRAG